MAQVVRSFSVFILLSIFVLGLFLCAGCGSSSSSSSSDKLSDQAGKLSAKCGDKNCL